MRLENTPETEGRRKLTLVIQHPAQNQSSISHAYGYLNEFTAIDSRAKIVTCTLSVKGGTSASLALGFLDGMTKDNAVVVTPRQRTSLDV